MKDMLERMGILALARRVWPTLNARLQATLDDDNSEDPYAGAREPRQRDPRGPLVAGIALEEPFESPLAQAVGTVPPSARRTR